MASLEPDGPRPFGVDAITDAQLVTWAAAVGRDSLDEVIGAARQRAYDPGPSASMQCQTRDGSLLSWCLTMPPVASSGELVGVVPFLIDWLDNPAELHPSRTSPGGCTLVSLAIGHRDADLTRDILGALALDVSVTHAPSPSILAEITGPAGTARLG
jgi:hypothetical protein